MPGCRLFYRQLVQCRFSLKTLDTLFETQAISAHKLTYGRGGYWSSSYTKAVQCDINTQQRVTTLHCLYAATRLTWASPILQKLQQLFQHKRPQKHDAVMHQFDYACHNEHPAVLLDHGFPDHALRGCHYVGGALQLSLKRLPTEYSNSQQTI